MIFTSNVKLGCAIILSILFMPGIVSAKTEEVCKYPDKLVSAHIEKILDIVSDVYQLYPESAVAKIKARLKPVSKEIFSEISKDCYRGRERSKFEKIFREDIDFEIDLVVIGFRLGICVQSIPLSQKASGHDCDASCALRKLDLLIRPNGKLGFMSEIEESLVKQAIKEGMLGVEKGKIHKVNIFPDRV